MSRKMLTNNLNYLPSRLRRRKVPKRIMRAKIENEETSEGEGADKVPFSFRGLIAPVLTPFNNDSTRTLNLSIIPQYADYLFQNKVTGVLVNGTSGEGPSMSVAERKLVAEAWVNAAKRKKQHVMVQVGGAPLPDVLELAKHAESIKVDSILCLPELFLKPTTMEQLTDYLKLVGSVAPNTPLLYYHNPGLTNVNLHMGQFLESLDNQIPTFVGMKFTSSNLEEAALVLRACKDKFTVFLGNDQLISAGSALGLHSFIATSANMFPELMLDTFTAVQEGNTVKAIEKQKYLTEAVIAITKYGSWVETMKVAMALLTDVNPGPPRAPQKPIPAEAIALMAKNLQKLGYQVKFQHL